MYKTIKTYILKNKGAILALFVFMAIAFYTGRVTNGNQNNLVLRDSVEVLQNKNKEYYSRINTYVVSMAELKLANSELHSEVKKLRDNPLTVNKVQTIVKYSSKLETEIVANSDKKEYNLNWSKDTIFSKGNYIKLAGISNLKLDSTFTPISYNSSLKSLEIASKLYISQTEKKGKIYLNARTDFPNLTFTEMEGYIVNPLPAKKKRVGLGAFVGVDFKGKPTVGIGLSYNLINF